MSQIVICGLGGQGILFLTRVMAEAAIAEGREVLAAETHGMSQRGGAVQAHVKLGEYSGSLVRRGCADAALALDTSRIESAQAFVRPGGPCFVNAADGKQHACDATGIARAMGLGRGPNLILLGFGAAARPDLFPGREALLGALDRLSPPPFREPNRRAFLRGAQGDA